MSCRVLQVLDAQLVQASELQLRAQGEAIYIDFLMTADEAKARRIGLLLRRLDRVFSVTWAAFYPGGEAPCTVDRIAVSLHSDCEQGPDTNPHSDFWRIAPSICMQADSYGRPVEGHETEIRLRWTEESLYFLFICAFKELHFRTDAPVLDLPAAELWKWDVAEVFVGPEAGTPGYCEFELSPQGEWLDLRIRPAPGGGISGSALNSGFVGSSRLDEVEKLWFGFLRIPCDAIAPDKVKAGDRLKINFYRSQGERPVEIAWRPTYNESFHASDVFGVLLLAK